MIDTHLITACLDIGESNQKDRKMLLKNLISKVKIKELQLPLMRNTLGDRRAKLVLARVGLSEPTLMNLMETTWVIEKRENLLRILGDCQKEACLRLDQKCFPAESTCI